MPARLNSRQFCTSTFTLLGCFWPGMSASLCFNSVSFWSILASLWWIFQNTQVQSTSMEILQKPIMPLSCPKIAENNPKSPKPIQSAAKRPKFPETTQNTPKLPIKPQNDNNEKAALMTQHCLRGHTKHKNLPKPSQPPLKNSNQQFICLFHKCSFLIQRQDLCFPWDISICH